MMQSDSLPKKPSHLQNRSNRWIIILFLLLTSPFLGEMLSGSAPPVEWLNPISALIIIVFYGTGTLLMWEARARWNLGWSIVFLAIAYGIVEEGIMMQSFFNHNHADLGELARYGMFFGVQWPWTIMLIIYHASISTLIPISLAGFLWPESKFHPLLGKKGLIITGFGFSTTTVFIMLVIWKQQAGFAVPYRPDLLLLVGSVVVTGFFIYLASLFKNAAITPSAMPVVSPVMFCLIACMLQLINLFFPNIMASSGRESWITLMFQGVILSAFLLFFRFQVFNKNATPRHYIGFVFGTVLSLILLTPLHHFINQMKGMGYVGLISFVLLLLWRRIALKKREN